MSRRIVGPKLCKLIPCGYCFEEWADCYDHIKPVSRGGTNKKSNLYPACSRCNGLVKAKLFESLDEKRDFIRAELKNRGEWRSGFQMQRMRESLPSKETTSSILFKQMPIAVVEERKPEIKDKKWNAVCVICGDRFWRIEEWHACCSDRCAAVKYFNIMLEAYFEKLKSYLVDT